MNRRKYFLLFGSRYSIVVLDKEKGEKKMKCLTCDRSMKSGETIYQVLKGRVLDDKQGAEVEIDYGVCFFCEDCYLEYSQKA